MGGTRGWCFTLNNYTDEEVAHLVTVGGLSAIQYLIFGKEVGERGTPHLQGYIHHRNGCSLRTIKSILASHRYHLEQKMGTTKQAVEYCKKEGDYQEFGKILARTDDKEGPWKAVLMLAQEGDIETIKEEYARIFICHFKTILSIRAFNNTPLDGELEHEWWYGPTGTGKSKKAWDEYPKHYSKAVNKWWDGYYGEDVVVIEEWEPKNECTAAKLKIWADRYPFPAEIKGGTLTRVRPRKIIVTSNYTIEQCFPKNEDSGPLKRRFKVLHFPNFGMEIPPPVDFLFEDFVSAGNVMFE